LDYAFISSYILQFCLVFSHCLMLIIFLFICVIVYKHYHRMKREKVVRELDSKWALYAEKIVKEDQNFSLEIQQAHTKYNLVAWIRAVETYSPNDRLPIAEYAKKIGLFEIVPKLLMNSLSDQCTAIEAIGLAGLQEYRHFVESSIEHPYKTYYASLALTRLDKELALHKVLDIHHRDLIKNTQLMMTLCEFSPSFIKEKIIHRLPSHIAKHLIT